MKSKSYNEFTIFPHPEALQICIFKSHLWSARLVTWNTENEAAIEPKILGLFSWHHTMEEIIEDWNTFQVSYLTGNYDFFNHYETLHPVDIPVMKQEIDVHIYRPSNQLSIWHNFPTRRALFVFDRVKKRSDAEDLWDFLQESTNRGDFVFTDIEGNRLEL